MACICRWNFHFRDTFNNLPKNSWPSQKNVCSLSRIGTHNKTIIFPTQFEKVCSTSKHIKYLASQCGWSQKLGCYEIPETLIHFEFQWLYSNSNVFMIIINKNWRNWVGIWCSGKNKFPHLTPFFFTWNIFSRTTWKVGGFTRRRQIYQQWKTVTARAWKILWHIFEFFVWAFSFKFQVLIFVLVCWHFWLELWQLKITNPTKPTELRKTTKKVLKPSKPTDSRRPGESWNFGECQWLSVFFVFVNALIQKPKILKMMFGRKRVIGCLFSSTIKTRLSNDWAISSNPVILYWNQLEVICSRFWVLKQQFRHPKRATQWKRSSWQPTPNNILQKTKEKKSNIVPGLAMGISCSTKHHCKGSFGSMYVWRVCKLAQISTNAVGHFGADSARIILRSWLSWGWFFSTHGTQNFANFFLLPRKWNLGGTFLKSVTCSTVPENQKRKNAFE